MRFGKFVLPLLLVFNASAAYSAPPKTPLALQVEWLGTTYAWQENWPKTSAPKTWEELEENNRVALRTVAGALRQLADERKLDAFGRLMLVRALALAIPLDAENRPRRFHEAWGKSWDERSRTYFSDAVLNELGFRTVRFESLGRSLLGIPTIDTELNSRTQTLTIEQSFFARKKSLTRTYVLWDLQGRIGDPQIGPGAADLQTPLDRIFERNAGLQVDFRQRTIPEELTARQTTAILKWPGGRAAAYNVFPDLARYLSLYPEHQFTAQVQLESKELQRTGLTRALKAFAAEIPEDRFVTEVLQAVQTNFRYVPGPLRSIHEILDSAHGDCDQLSAVLALLLLESGYPQESIAAIVWNGADHMGLALRPRQKAPANAAKISYQNYDYYVLDTTYYRKREGEIITAWGDMNPNNAALAATIQHVGGKP